MKIVNIAQRTPEWHEWRNSGVSASEAIVVLGKCPLRTVYRLYTEKKGLTLPDNLDANPFVQRGIRLEATARFSFEDRHNALLLPVCAESEEFPFLRASFDGLNDDGIPTELKVPMEVNFRDAQQNGINSKIYQRYYYQVQQQIAVAGSDRGYLSFYLNGKEPPLDFLILRDDQVIQELVFKAREFVEYLNKNRPPATDPDRDIYIPQGNERLQWQALAADYHRNDEVIREFKAKIEPLLQQQAELEKGLVELMGDFSHAESTGLRISRYLAQGSIDYKAALMALNPNIDAAFLETFRKQSSERSRMTVKGEEKATVPFSMNEIMAVRQLSNLWF